MSMTTAPPAANPTRRATFEFPAELVARLDVASRARGIPKAVLVRTVLTDWLIQNTVAPAFAAPPLEASREAYAVGRGRGAAANAALADVFGTLPK